MKISREGAKTPPMPLTMAAACILLGSAGVAQKPAKPAWKPPEIVELDEHRKPAIQTKGDCFIRGGTIITITQGVIQNGAILVTGGKIAAIGKDLTPPAGVPVIEAKGKFVTPGIIDAHSHIAIDESNEFSDSITAEVRMHDVLDPHAPGIYRKLASGFTAAMVLHGSANPIGGQSVVIKLKWKRPAHELPVPDAPRMIKFALGENVKQSNPFPGQTTRFPKTRMGVEAVYRRAFAEAKRYMAEWEAYERGRQGASAEFRVPSSEAGGSGSGNLHSELGTRNSPLTPPRRDLRLGALADILRGNIRVQCHCYRADEMLMMLRLSKEFGFKLVFQHALEAYKIAPEIAAAGAGVSTFADDWGYKVEAYDAIPYNAAMCLRAGIVTSVNTDTFDGVTPLNLDAAKAMKYGGLTETEALELVTINPAIQLGIAHRTGSLEIGKDADIAIWDGHPLSSYSRCAMTMVEGVTYFQRRDAFGLDQQAVIASAVSTSGTNHDQTVPPDAKSYAIVGGTLHPISGPDILEGTVVVEDGRIQTMGKSVGIPKGAYVLHAKGWHVWPGLIDAGSALGLKEIDQVDATIDASESGQFQPDALALTAVNPASEHFAVARSEGITTTLVRPGSGGDGFFGGGGPMVGGQGAVIHTTGWTPDGMCLTTPAGLHVRYPTGVSTMPDFIRRLLPPEELDRRKKLEKQQERQFREYFERAKRYATARAQAADKTPVDVRLESMIPYVTGKQMVVFHGGKPKTIRTEIALADELGLKIALADVPQAWKLADMLAKKQIPVICSLPVVETTGGDFTGETYDPYDAPFSYPALLNRAGVKIAFESDNAALAKNLRLEAGVACAFGLPKEAAYRALTLGAAEILGVADRVGSLAPGKSADLIVTDGDPLEIQTSMHYAFIGGKPVSLENRHTRLYRQYSERLKRKE